ncbi:MAG: acyl-CoA thioesterase [Sphingobacteriales bacterium]|nr:MAG: acyl-CoA thioesterase [Sphingobacteriales bacterium]
MYVHETQVRVRYGETDQMGYLYYGNYALYYEVGRTESLRSLGFSYKGLEAVGVMLPVIKLESEYFRPAFYDDLITIRTSLQQLPGTAEITFVSELFNEKGKLLNRGIVTLVFYDRSNKKKILMPTALYEALAPYYQ